MKKVALVFGTRPEAIKMISLIKELKSSDELEPIVISTGQHQEMLQTAMDDFDCMVDYNLDVMEEGQDLSKLTTKIIDRVSKTLDEVKPDIVLVHGDTTSTLGGALAAFYKQIPIGHVEAGLRTYNLQSPFPEEANRQLTDRLVDLHFTPTTLASDNLYAERITTGIYNTGNTVTDMIKYTVTSDEIHPYTKIGKRNILLTMHRRENIGKNMEDTFTAINSITNEFDNLNIVFPMHKNPKVREIAHKYFDDNSSVQLVEPMSMIDLHNFIKHAYLVMTDSGGIQEEVPSFKIPTLILRDTTERPEGVDAGVAELIGTESSLVYNYLNSILNNNDLYKSLCDKENPYGDGKVAKRIVNIILSYLQKLESE